MIATLFPHLDPEASWTIQQEAGDRLRAIYTAGARERQARAIGAQNVHLGDVQVMLGYNPKRTYLIGLGYPWMMGRALIVHRAMARLVPRDRRHHIKNALRLRDSLCWWGLDKSMRGA